MSTTRCALAHGALTSTTVIITIEALLTICIVISSEVTLANTGAQLQEGQACLLITKLEATVAVSGVIAVTSVAGVRALGLNKQTVLGCIDEKVHIVDLIEGLNFEGISGVVRERCVKSRDLDCNLTVRRGLEI